MDIAMNLAAWPLWLSAALIVGATTCLAMLCSFMVRRTVGLERLTTNNEVAGFKFGTIGVIYAVMLGFAVIVVWEKYREADIAVANEAGAIVALYRLSEGVTAEGGASIRKDINSYVRAVIASDWPSMARGTLSAQANEALNKLYAAAFAAAPAGNRGASTLAELFHQLDQVTQSRRQRGVLCGGIVPGVIWAALFLGACLTIGFTFFFGTRNLGAQVLMTGLLSFLIFMVLLVIISIDHPFTGDVSVQPEALVQALHEFGNTRG
ncbi:MAG TPA: hypothetical protein VFX37_10060 [Pseudolabrys sp.]|nr:hypothetical protein [Pseudolabrys sp.]